MYDIGDIKSEYSGWFYPWDEWYHFQPIKKPIIAYYSSFPEGWTGFTAGGWYVIDHLKACFKGPMTGIWGARGAYKRYYA